MQRQPETTAGGRPGHFRRGGSLRKAVAAEIEPVDNS